MNLKRYSNTYVAIIIVLSAIAILLNHASLQLGHYDPESEHQRENVERGRLSVVGSYVVGVDFDGSVVPPAGFGNDLRTFAIDAIIVAQAIGLLYAVRQKKI